MIASTKTQIRNMFRKWEFKAAMLISLAYACAAFIFMAKENWGLDASMIKDANQSVCYGVNNRYLEEIVHPFLYL